MSTDEDQLEEIEALESIFPDCFTLIDNTAPYRYTIKILPNVEGCGDNHGKLCNCYFQMNLILYIYY